MLEYNLYKKFAGLTGIPKVYYYEREGDFNCMVMEALGPSLEDLFGFCKKQFTVKTTCMIAIEMINRIETLHKQKFIHRDIKPDNFLIGTGS